MLIRANPEASSVLAGWPGGLGAPFWEGPAAPAPALLDPSSLLTGAHWVGDLLVYGFVGLVVYNLFLGPEAKGRRTERKRQVKRARVGVKRARTQLQQARGLPRF